MLDPLRRISGAAMLLAWALSSAPAYADATEQARQHFDRGLGLVDDGQYSEAIVEFNRCYELKPHYAVFYNIGQAYIALAKPVEAAAALRRYLDEGGKAIDAKRRAAVEKEIQRQQARIATLDIRVLPAGATVRLDGAELGRSPLSAPVPVGVGTHTVTASFMGYEPGEATATVAGGDRGSIELNLVQLALPGAGSAAPPPPPPPAAGSPAAPQATEPTPAAPAQAAPPVPDASSSGSTMRTLGVLIAATGVVGLGAGATCWFVASSKHEDALSEHQLGNYDDAHQLQSQSEQLVPYVNVGFIGGGVLAAAGAVLYLVAPSDRPPHFGYDAPVWPLVAGGFVGLATKGTF
jgi:tetratricopeptide (TPR) repeat protein